MVKQKAIYMIKAVIFDMDGILIDSEPIWHEAEIEVFGRVGLEMTVQDCLKTQGLRVDEVVDFWHRQHPWTLVSKTEVADQIVEAVITGVRHRGTLIDGARHALEFVSSLGLPVALASSSSYALINAVIDKFDIRSYFKVIYSAQDEVLGKPHPAVYITTAEKMQVAADECVAIEDSINGVISAKAAKMACSAMPEPTARYDRRFGMADGQIASLHQVGPELWATLPGNEGRF